ncbi:MAG TPA: sugar phosphate isomerase/epimerase [Ktedonobacteraceae bacterium]|nr:sugar phosphate isomerase/epimerase [Ktedonobacteraceae bacterium]
MSNLKVALQLYTMRNETARDFSGTIRRVAELGYPGVEFAGYGGLSSQELVALLAETGLQPVSTHVGLDALQDDKLDDSIRYCKEIGCSFLVLPFLMPELRTPEAFQTLAPRLNVIGQRCREQGITFAYHNHDFEFERIGDVYLMDHLLQATDPDLVKLEVDVYWVAYAGLDPVSYLQKLGERVVLLHLKDMEPDQSMTEVGKGTLNMKQIWGFAQARDLWGIVEQDYPKIPALESARISLAYFGITGKQ